MQETDSQGSRWTFQAARMDGQVGSFRILPDQMQVINPVLIIVFIPIFDKGIYPLASQLIALLLFFECEKYSRV